MDGQRARPRYRRSGWSRRRLGIVAALAVLAVTFGGCVAPPSPPTGWSNTGPRLPLAQAGRWFVDATGRVVLPRGVNVVEKSPPFSPAATGFGDDDAALLASHGFNTLRLGVVFEALMPEPGRIDHSYIDRLAETVRVLERHDILVLLDFHQDGYGPLTHGNGMPAWATLTDGVPNPPVPFPLYYVQNPAIQRAFDNFWANRPGPDGVPLQTHYAAGMRAVAQRFAGSRTVIGYEAMNEPWPGSDWIPCVTGCPEHEHRLLVPFYARMAAAVRSVDARHPLFVEPFVTFNFGQGDTSLPAARSDALSTHVYALDAASDLAVMQRSVAAAERGDAALLVTEWGATNDPAAITRVATQLDETLVPWVFWAYNENVLVDHRAPATGANVRGPVLDALTRPYPTVTNGTPTRIAFDASTGILDIEYATRRPNGSPAPPSLESVVSVPRARYPNGYTVAVSGARVTSRPCAENLTLRNLASAPAVTVHVTPGGGCVS